MVFDYKRYEAYCALQSTSIKQLNANHGTYIKQIAEGTASAVTGVVLAKLTFGMSLVGTAVGTAMAANAGKKINIIEKELQKRNQPVPVMRGANFAQGFGEGASAVYDGMAEFEERNPGW